MPIAGKQGGTGLVGEGSFDEGQGWFCPGEFLAARRVDPRVLILAQRPRCPPEET